MWKLDSKLLSGMVEHARRDYPREACGILAGRGRRIWERIECANIAVDPRAFEIAPEELFAVLRRLRQEGAAPLGVYHSHPGSQEEPSLRDHTEHFYPDWGYWIVSFPPGEPVVRCFQWTKHGFVPVQFRVNEGTDEKIR